MLENYIAILDCTITKVCNQSRKYKIQLNSNGISLAFVISGILKKQNNGLAIFGGASRGGKRAKGHFDLFNMSICY